MPRHGVSQETCKSPRAQSLGPTVAGALQAAAPAAGFLLAAAAVALPALFEWLKLLVLCARAFAAPLPPDVTATLVGLLLCVFGGEFAALACAYEAFTLAGGRAAVGAASVVAAELRAFAAASAEEDAVEAKDAPAAAAAQEPPQPATTNAKKGASKGAKAAAAAAAAGPSPLALLRRKALLFARLSHPDALSAAWAQLAPVALAVFGALRLEAARALTLSVAVADAVQPAAAAALLPSLDAASPPELAAWNATLVAGACKCLAVLLGWLFYSLLAAVHSAVKGGKVAADGLLRRARHHGLLPPLGAGEAEPLARGAALALAALGLTAQLATGFRAPLAVRVAAAPLVLANWVLTVAVVG